MTVDSSPFLRCFACGDLGVELDASGVPRTCWRMRAGAPHNELSPAARTVDRALTVLRIEKRTVDPHLLDVVRLLAQHSSLDPCRRDAIIERHFSFSPSALRVFHTAVEHLRRVWLLPVASRKEPPAGYWISVDPDDFAAYIARAKASPLTQLTTVYRLARRNFPLLAEQFEFEFWNDIEPPVTSDAAP
jgi:hypothetical protein